MNNFHSVSNSTINNESFEIGDSESEARMMKTVCVVGLFIVGFTMKNFCASAQQHGPTRIPSGHRRSRQCTTSRFMCNNGECISLVFRCDGDNDCIDRSDEENCRHTSPSQIGCRSDEFQCRIMAACIPAMYQCDGDEDCLDDTDEIGCDTYTSTAQFGCRSDEFQCRIRRSCIPTRFRCDGDEDCLDGTDETGCIGNTVHACNDGALLIICRTGLIQVHDVVLGSSSCYGRSCCPRWGDCSGSPSANYRNQVNAACNNQTSCSLSVEIRNIGCGLFPNNDYTNLTYSCKGAPAAG